MRLNDVNMLQDNLKLTMGLSNRLMAMLEVVITVAPLLYRVKVHLRLLELAYSLLD